MRNLTLRWPKSGHFCPKLGHSFPIFEKGQGRPPPPPPSSYAPVLLLSGIKLDGSFPTAQFPVNGFSKPCRLDNCLNGGGILLYVRDEIPSRLLTDYKIKDNLESFFVEVLDRHAPKKQKYIRANNSDYITKALRKEIMHRSRNRNKFLRERKQMNLRLSVTGNEISA